MTHAVNDDVCPASRLERIAAALGAGIVLLDSNRKIAWIDRRTRARLNGGMEQLASTLRTMEVGPDGITCCVWPAEVTINGEAAMVCLVQEIEEQKEQGFDVIAALEAAMTDTSWFTRTLIAKLKTLRHSNHQPAPRTMDLESLTD